MTLPLLALSVMIVLAVAYRLYGSLIARQYRLDPDAVTPAHRLADGIDFVPTAPVYLLPQHFAAISAARRESIFDSRSRSAGSARGETEMRRNPRPTRIGRSSGSAPISPHRLTGFPAASALAITKRNMRRIAG